MIDFHSAHSAKEHIRFVIPSYQRGYRWRKEDVEKLLKDLLTHTECRYCLQPLELQELEEKDIPSWVISKRRDWRDYAYYRVVDGQQRLTTVSIVSHILGCSFDWDILYDTEETLLSEMLPCKSDSRINDFFRKQVYESAETFIRTRKSEDRERLFCYFSGEESKLSIVFPTHYLPLDEKTDPEGHNAFARLNAGKTPLTSSELIRALYMVQDNGLSENQRIEIAKEWELIENTLNQEQYWRMFKAGTLADTPTRIDLLFALVLKAKYQNFKWDGLKINPRMIFETLETKYYDGEINLQKLWHEVIRCFWWIQSSYEDVETYNYLGWIALCTNNMAYTVYQDFLFLDKPSKENFRKTLVSKILDNGVCDIPRRYENPKLKDLLLLLNILECNKSKVRFSFDRLDTYDVEHIDSQTPNDLSNKHDRLVWLKSIWDEYRDATILEMIKKVLPDACEQSIDKDIETFCERPFTDEVLAGFQDVLQKCRSVDEAERIADKHALGNLTLLNSHINRSYGNAIFPRKRKKIIKAIEDGLQYIPPCTIKVFMKFYTNDPSHITEWLQHDFVLYQKQMEKLLDEFQKMDVATKKTDRVMLDLAPDVPVSVLSPTDRPQGGVAVSPKEKMTGEISFPTLMDHYHIRIPKIQRLYVQGRLDSYGQNCLHGFAQALVDSVIKGTAFPLDMIYGIMNTVEGNKTEVFFPLDGQQRLTTLLLLAWLCGKVSENWKLDYESRRATEIFIEELLQTKPLQIEHHEKSKKEDYPPKCTQFIEEQGWFLTVWKQDPGIAGMLRMLDSLYDKLAQSKLENYTFDKITFSINYLDVSDKSYDHIFLKMNSRGRQLTAWENLKAVLDKNLRLADPRPQEVQHWRDNIDLNWPEKLWPGFDNDIEALDRCMTGIIELAARYAGYQDKIEDTFSFDQWLSNPEESEKSGRVKKLFGCATILFEAVHAGEDQNMLSVLRPAWATDTRCPKFVRQYSPDQVAQFYKPLLAYYAATKSKNADWMRIIWNLVENGEITRNNFSRVCAVIDDLSGHADNIITFLIADESIGNTEPVKAQLLEERAKARKILSEDGKQWKDLITRAEKHPLLHGDLGAILWDDHSTVADWSAVVDCFYEFLPLKSEHELRFENDDDYSECGRLLLWFGDYSVQDKRKSNNWVLGTNRDCWETILHAHSNQSCDRVRPVLLEYLEHGTPKTYTKKDWQFYFINYPQFFLHGCNCYHWENCHFLIKKMTKTTLGGRNCNPFLEAIANGSNDYDGYWVNTSDAGRIHDKESNISVWIEVNAQDGDGIHFCIEINDSENERKEFPIDLNRDVVAQGRKLLLSLRMNGFDSLRNIAEDVPQGGPVKTTKEVKDERF